MASKAFNELQESIIQRKKFDNGKIKNALLYRSKSPETYAIFRLALLSKRMDPTELLIESSIMAIEYDDLFIRFTALALRYGADVNVYVEAGFTFYYTERNSVDENQTVETEEIIKIPVPLAKRLWDLVPRTVEESFRKDRELFGDFELGESENIVTDTWKFTPPRDNSEIQERYTLKQVTFVDIISMMTIKDFNPDLPITTAELLNKNDINATKFAINNPQFFSSIYADMKLDSTNTNLSQTIISEIKFFQEWKGSLQSVFGIDRNRDIRLLNYAILLDLPEILTLSDIYGIADNLREMFIFQDNKSLEIIIPRLQVIELIGDEKTTPRQKELELLLFDWSIAYYNQTGIKLLLDIGIVPDYSVRSTTIRAAKNICRSFPILCQILNKCIIDYVEHGYGLSSDQMTELAFEPRVQEAIRKEYSTPAWKHMCKVKGGEINPDMKDVARKLGIPLGSNKEQICSTLEDLSKTDPHRVKETLHDVNKNHIIIESTSAAEIISGKRRKPTLNSNNSERNELTPKAARENQMPICSNATSLPLPIEDVPEIDRVTYFDGNDTWCFISNDFPDIIRTKTNPWARNNNGSHGAPVPIQVIDEMQRKLNMVESQGLDNRTPSINKAVDEIFEATPERTQEYYDREIKRRLNKFFDFADSYGIAPEIFSELNRNDFQILSNEVLSPINRLDVDKGLPSVILEDFADKVLVEIDNFQTPDEVGNKLRELLL